ncbi:MAG: BamA/TamA family outer membrane protein [Opitutaceae bacterium]|nr:BamA/TamA family outer membrane protein [Opitutaceae bacterium]
MFALHLPDHGRARRMRLCVAAALALNGSLATADSAGPGADASPAPAEPVRIAGMRLSGSAVAPESELGPLSPLEVVPEGGAAAVPDDAPKSEWLIAPIPGYTPVFGATLAVGVAKLYRPHGYEKEPRAWTTGGGAFLAENDSWGVGVGHKMGLGLDTWRLTGGALYGDLIYKFYGIGNDAGDADQFVELSHRAPAVMVSALRKVGSRWYLGANFAAADSDIRLADRFVPPGFELPPELDSPDAAFSPLLVSFTPRVQYDSRDSEYYPADGILFEAKVGVCSESIGSDFDFRAYEIAYNQYFSWSSDDAFALRLFGRYAEGDVPFFAMSSLGQGSDLRGYTPGRYRDNALLTMQGEYRRRIARRWYAVAFGGLGAVGPTVRDIGQALPAGGVGVRFVLAEENHVALRFDAAWGKDDNAIYLSVGEAF